MRRWADPDRDILRRIIFQLQHPRLAHHQPPHRLQHRRAMARHQRQHRPSRRLVSRAAGFRIWHGRPLRLLARAIIPATLPLLVLHLVAGQLYGPAVVTGPITWFALTGRGDLAPPPGR